MCADSVIPFYEDGYALTDWDADRNKWHRSMVIETLVERWNEDTGEEYTVRVTRTVIGCSICSNPALPQHSRDDNPSVCSFQCGRIEDELCEAANEAYYRRMEG